MNAISFTGSVPVGKGIAASAIQNLTKIQMEMGSKNALAVMDDGDLNIASAIALGGAFGGSGQKCTASSRLIVHESIHDALVEKLVTGAKAMVVDHALKEGTQMGPVVSETQLNENLAYMDLAREEGGEVLCGGERVPQFEGRSSVLRPRRGDVPQSVQHFVVRSGRGFVHGGVPVLRVVMSQPPIVRQVAVPVERSGPPRSGGAGPLRTPQRLPTLAASAT